MARRGKVQAYKRRSEVLSLYAAGREPEDIVAIVNQHVAEGGEGTRTTLGAVNGIITRQLARWEQGANPADVEDARKLALERLDQMTSALWKRVKSGDPRAIDTALRIEERRARIMGLERPVQHEHKHEHDHQHQLVDREEIDRAQQAFLDAGADITLGEGDIMEIPVDQGSEIVRVPV